MAFIENRTPFFADFGEAALLGGVSAAVIFDNDFMALLGVESSSPTALIDASDATLVAHGSSVAIRSVNYRVVGIHPDGTGFTVLELERV